MLTGVSNAAGPNDHTIAQIKDVVRDGLRAVKNTTEDEAVIMGKYKVYNLCSERLYDASLFQGKVAFFPFEDNNCPPLQLILLFCESAYSWLKEDIENVVVVHCKAGMARTGLMISSLLIFLKRYVKYFERILTHFERKILPDRRCMLRGFRLHRSSFRIRPSITVSNHKGIILCLLLLIGLVFVSESPRWLPRKWNVCVVGSHDLFEHPHINDLAYMPAMKNGRFGFNLLVGGFFSPKQCAEAVPLDAWVPGEDVIPVCKATLQAYKDLGTRGNRKKTRIMWLIDELGIEGFRSEVVKRMPGQELERSSVEELVQKQWERRDYIGVHPQKQSGYNFVGLHIPVGRLQADNMDELVQIADEYGSGKLRLTVEQNIIIPDVENSKLDALLKEPLLNDRFSPTPPLLMKNLVACTGNQFCGQAIIETKARICNKLLQYLEELYKHSSTTSLK